MRERAVVEVEVFIDVHDPDVLGRVNDPEFREQMGPGFDDERDVIKHLAFNAVQNRIYDVSRLDGWADLPDNAATILTRVGDIEVDESGEKR